MKTFFKLIHILKDKMNISPFSTLSSHYLTDTQKLVGFRFRHVYDFSNTGIYWPELVI